LILVILFIIGRDGIDSRRSFWLICRWKGTLWASFCCIRVGSPLKWSHLISLLFADKKNVINTNCFVLHLLKYWFNFRGYVHVKNDIRHHLANILELCLLFSNFFIWILLFYTELQQCIWWTRAFHPLVSSVLPALLWPW